MPRTEITPPANIRCHVWRSWQDHLWVINVTGFAEPESVLSGRLLLADDMWSTQSVEAIVAGLMPLLSDSWLI
jgi:hypothetical protein